jgi:uncharacterized membrane protein SirB2
MRWSALLLAVLCLLVGAIWILQGAGVLAGSFMTGQRLWLAIGIALVLAAIILGFVGLRRPARG